MTRSRSRARLTAAPLAVPPLAPRAFSEPVWEQVKAATAGERFSGVLVDADGELNPFAVLSGETR